MDWADHALALPAVGLVGGVMLGLAARCGRFCTLGAIEDALYGADLKRVRMWAMALAVTILGTFTLASAGALDLSATLYAQTSWNPIASVVGGLIFGYGMAIAGNCGYGALARLGGGDLRSLVIVMVMGISAYAVLSGPLAGLRVALFPIEAAAHGSSPGYAHLVGGALGTGPLVPALLASLAIGAWALTDPDFRAARTQIMWSTVAGLAIVSAWAGTTFLAANSFDIVAIESHAFTAPVGETLLYLMTASAGAPGLAIGSVVGVVLGAVIGSIRQGHFRWEACDDPQELGRQILGGALMGIGGILALGCSVGQGLTAFSTLAYSAPVTLAAIVAGAALGLRHLIRGFSAA